MHHAWSKSVHNTSTSIQNIYWNDNTQTISWSTSLTLIYVC